MSFELVLWKRKPNAVDAGPREIYEYLCDDEPHPALSRFDQEALAASLTGAFGDVFHAPPAAEANGPFLVELAEFEENGSNCAFVEAARASNEDLERLIGLIAELGLELYDPQNDELFLPP